MTVDHPVDGYNYGDAEARIDDLMEELEQAHAARDHALSQLSVALVSFLRCADCEELYIASYGWQFTTGKWLCYWAKPRPKRTPKICKHPNNRIERWDGTAWIACGDPVPGAPGGGE